MIAVICFLFVAGAHTQDIFLASTRDATMDPQISEKYPAQQPELGTRRLQQTPTGGDDRRADRNMNTPRKETRAQRRDFGGPIAKSIQDGTVSTMVQQVMTTKERAEEMTTLKKMESYGHGIVMGNTNAKDILHILTTRRLQSSSEEAEAEPKSQSEQLSEVWRGLMGTLDDYNGDLGEFEQAWKDAFKDAFGKGFDAILR